MIRFAQVLQNNDGEWFLQIAKTSDLRLVDVSWQNNRLLGDACWTPDVDIEAWLIPCENYAQAMLMLAKHYKNELEKA